MELMQNLWTPEYQRLLERLNEYITEGPILARTEPSQRFYIKVDWSKDGMGDVLSQEGGSWRH